MTKTTPLYWVNLAARADRRAHMEAQLASLGMEHRRVEAYGPADVLAAGGRIRLQGGERRTASELACLCSHLEAVRRAWFDARAGDKTATTPGWGLVAEDDLVLRRSYDYARVASGAPEGAELLQLSVMHSRALDASWTPDVRSLWRAWIPWHYGAQLYMVRLDLVEERLRLLGLDPELPVHEQAAGVLDLRAVSGSVPVADDLLFRLFRTYNTRVPLSSGDVGLGSDIHEDQLAEHVGFWGLIDGYTSRPNVAAILDGLEVAKP